MPPVMVPPVPTILAPPVNCIAKARVDPSPERPPLIVPPVLSMVTPARPIIVDVDIVAVGAEETYSYLCARTKGSAFVRRVMG